jgi:hypothetical protein
VWKISDIRNLYSMKFSTHPSHYAVGSLIYTEHWKNCSFFPDLPAITVYLHAYGISVLAGDVEWGGQVPPITVGGSSCLQQNNAAVGVPVFYGTEQRGLSFAVHYVDRRTMLQQQRHAVRVAICRSGGKLEISDNMARNVTDCFK